MKNRVEEHKRMAWGSAADRWQTGAIHWKTRRETRHRQPEKPVQRIATREGGDHGLLRQCTSLQLPLYLTAFHFQSTGSLTRDLCSWATLFLRNYSIKLYYCFAVTKEKSEVLVKIYSFTVTAKVTTRKKQWLCKWVEESISPYQSNLGFQKGNKNLEGERQVLIVWSRIRPTSF